MTRQECLDRIAHLTDVIERYPYKNVTSERQELENLRALIDRMDAPPPKKGRAA